MLYILHYIKAAPLIIYLRIIRTALESDRLSQTEKAALKHQLNEGIDPCSPGYFNRIRNIIELWQLPENIDQLLNFYRKKLVERTAIAEGDGDIHTYNRFFTIANSIGFAAATEIHIDPYPGNLNDHAIERHLRVTFASHYNYLSILTEPL